MHLKRIFKEIPKLPLSALIFYLVVVALWNLNIIPAPGQIVTFLENLYNQYGLFGLSIATFLEGIVYLGLYFPGSFIIVLAIFFSDGGFLALTSISLVVAITLTITSIINYFLGRHIMFHHRDNEELIKKHDTVSKGFFLSMLHPNLLAFYFFHAGLEKHNVWKILLVPFIITPYMFGVAWIFSTFKDSLRSTVESPHVMLLLIIVWIVVAFFISHLSKKRRHKIYEELD